MAEGQRVDIPRVKLGTQGLEVAILGECDHFYRKNHPEFKSLFIFPDFSRL